MVSIKKIFGSHDHANDDGGDLRHAPSGASLKSSGHETDAKRKNDELASRGIAGQSSSSSNSNNDNLGHRKSLSNSNNTGLTSNSPRSSTIGQRDSTTTGYNTDADNTLLSSGTHANNANAKGAHEQGLDKIGSHRGIVGEVSHPSTGASSDGSRPIVEVLSRETVPETSKTASDHILHTHTGVTHENTPARSAVDTTPRSTTVPTAGTSEKTGHGRLSSSSSGRGFDNPHETGHVASRALQEFDPKLADHDHVHLQHVTHRQVRHVEVEEVERQREVDRHIHHVQTHVQPILDKKILPEKISENLIAPTKVNEVHASTQEDVQLFTQLATQHRDTESHRAKERTVVDLGEKVTEKVIHHVHHVTQPIIEQEIVERHRIHTVIPVHHVTHEAPIIHKSSTHAPVSLNDFLSGGGKLDSHVTADSAGLLANDDCERIVDGPAETLIQQLNLGSSTNYGHSHSGSHDHTHSRESTSSSGAKYESKDGDLHKSKIAAKVDDMTPSNNRVGSTTAI